MTEYTLENQSWKLKVQNKGEQRFCYILQSKIDNMVYADEDYHYRILTSSKKGSRYMYLLHLGSEHKAKKLSSRNIRKEDSDTLIIEGKFEETDIKITHEFKLEEYSKCLEEKITLTNLGNKKVRFGLLNFGFKKAFYKQYSGWVDHLDEFTLTSIPTRRYIRYGADRRKENFSANDILFGAWVAKEAEMPGFCAEGWLWGNEEGGLLICKYNPTQMEYSRFNRLPTTLPGRGAEDIAILFGGVSLYEGNPELATTLKPNQNYTFGTTRYTIYEGDYKEGYYLYRSHLEKHGHRFKQDYDPPVHWNELYNLGWVSEKTGFFVDSTDFEVYTLEQLFEEAEIARDMGAECLYLDPGWNISLGSSIWNEERFGTLKEFSKEIHEKYGLKLALHLMMNFEGENEPEEFYLRNKRGVKLIADPYINLYCLCANSHWVEEKTRRILEIAKEGVDFFMFDFTDLSMFMENDLGCFSKDHGHEVPMLRHTHAENIFKVIQNVKKEFPHILIEAHDRGVKPRHPLYYQHNLPHSFDENWGFECMWNPMQDLLSGRSTQLFEYNLAYSIPLYLHINENSDNKNMLQFWWYASLARHLGIGGLKDRDSPKYKTLKDAMKLYKQNKSFFTRGIFYGIDYNIHLHVSEIDKSGVITAYNLSSRVQKLDVQIDLMKYGLEVSSVVIYSGLNQKISSGKLNKKSETISQFEVEIPPLSPIIAILQK
ncbi:MAG: hypothetical protein HWN79_17730 [Candidatus Lokiarchaeota archaeon]|nr:hypothetical protein [Candidatus Lokiarchaeota archaeon]